MNFMLNFHALTFFVLYNPTCLLAMLNQKNYKKRATNICAGMPKHKKRDFSLSSFHFKCFHILVVFQPISKVPLLIEEYALHLLGES